jgi:hypothetical protein
MAVKTDDLEAVRVVAETLQPFTVDDRERIMRWAREKLGMAVAVASPVLQRTDVPPADALKEAVSVSGQAGVDIKKFVTEKAPRSDTHFAATVAYYHSLGRQKISEKSQSPRKTSLRRAVKLTASGRRGRRRSWSTPIKMGCSIAAERATTS